MRLAWPNYDSLSIIYPRGVWADCHASLDRNAVYGYLSAAYGLVAWWAVEGRNAKSIEPARALRSQRSVPLLCRDPFAAVIRWTADPANADRSKRSCMNVWPKSRFPSR